MFSGLVNRRDTKVLRIGDPTCLCFLSCFLEVNLSRRFFIDYEHKRVGAGFGG
jgi:hypothetical protein